MTVRYWTSALVLPLLMIAAGSDPARSAEPRAERYVTAVRTFADTVLAHGRDDYGPQKTPLFVDGLEVTSLEPVRWQKGGETWVLSNFASQQPLLRLLDGLTALTGEAKYRAAAEETTKYALEHLQSPNGLLYWGGHLAWDLEAEKVVGQGTDTHELKGHQPYYEFMWRVDPESTRKLMEAIWATHVLDWSLLDYNRHASVKKAARPQWEHAFAEDIAVPFPAQGGNLSFANVTPPLVRSGTMLAILGNDENAMLWTRRLLYRWQQAKDPNTGLCGGQLSYRKQDRAQEALGHVHPTINEAQIVASYHQTCRYHEIPLIEMQAGEALIAAGGARAELGRQFIRWASDDLTIYARNCYDPQQNVFVAKMIDGTPIRWQESKTGYYVPSSFAPAKPDGELLWAYATAYRLTKDEQHWKMVRTIARSLDLGELDQKAGHGSPNENTGSTDWLALYALLELFRATGERPYLELADRIGHNLLATQARSGLFPRKGRSHARTGDDVPLALLHLAAALEGREAQLPPPVSDNRFFHCEYDGPLEEFQKKRADARTYDHLVFYGS